MAIKFFIDQGHNPKTPNTGAEGNGLYEQDLTYEIGIRLAALLRANGNFDVRLSRPTPETQLGSSNTDSLRQRTNAANAFGADWFLSIHTNASSAPSAGGSEAFVYSLEGKSDGMAESILKYMTEATGLRNRGVFARPSLYVLRKTAMPAILLEVAFITNPYEAAMMRDNPGLFARGIYNGIVEYLGV